jgi:hypothetical protein
VEKGRNLSLINPVAGEVILNNQSQAGALRSFSVLLSINIYGAIHAIFFKDSKLDSYGSLIPGAYY